MLLPGRTYALAASSLHLHIDLVLALDFSMERP
jgi:hypothetical protein